MRVIEFCGVLYSIYHTQKTKDASGDHFPWYTPDELSTRKHKFHQFRVLDHYGSGHESFVFVAVLFQVTPRIVYQIKIHHKTIKSHEGLFVILDKIFDDLFFFTSPDLT